MLIVSSLLMVIGCGISTASSEEVKEIEQATVKNNDLDKGRFEVTHLIINEGEEDLQRIAVLLSTKAMWRMIGPAQLFSTVQELEVDSISTEVIDGVTHYQLFLNDFFYVFKIASF